ncbi:MAG: ABC transporter permease [Polyangiales bacterium]
MADPIQRLRGLVAGTIRDPNPILVKELRSTLRSKLFIRFLYLSTGVVGLVVMSAGAIFASGPITPAEVGSFVFQTFFVTALLLTGIAAPAYAAASMTSEKEVGTYESLILTGLEPWRIVRGKFLAATASVGLVLVAFAPVVGIAFLFGGISPWHVLTGFWGLALALAPAIALGIALSSHLRSTRIAILLALGISLPMLFFGTIALGGLGEVAKNEWSIGMGGPFWFAEALPARLFEFDTFVLLGLIPIYVFGMAVWFLLAGAVAGVRPKADDRSTPFKVWSVVSWLGLTAIVAGVPLLASRNDVGEMGVALFIAANVAFLFYGLLFMNEPPLPPRRLAEQLEQAGPLRRALLHLFGPGGAPTARFTASMLVFGPATMAFSTAALRHVVHPGLSNHGPHDVALGVLCLGNGAVTLFIAMFGGWLRSVLRSGIAARALSLALLFAVSILPFLMQLIVDVNALEDLDDQIPPLIMIAPALPSILGVNISSEDMNAGRALMVVIPAALYGAAAMLLWTMLEVRVRGVRKQEERRQEAYRERAEAREREAGASAQSAEVEGGKGKGKLADSASSEVVT